MFRDAYTNELEVLRRLATELGERFPDLAPMLGRDADAATSRLFQRLAFAFAHVEQRTEDDVPEIIHAIFEDLDPRLLQPTLAATLIELVPPPKTQRGAVVVDAGATFAAARLTDQPLLFRATEPCEVRPWALRHAEIGNSGRREIGLDIEVLPGGTLARSIGSDTIIISIAGKRLEDALDMRSLLVRHVRSVRARAGATQVLLADAVSSVFGTSALSRPSAFSAVREAFAAPLVFCRVEIRGARKVLALGEAIRNFEIVLELDESVPERFSIDTSLFHLHGVVAVSLSSLEARLEPTDTGRYILRTTDVDERIVDVEHVAVVEDGSSRSISRWTPAMATRSLDEGSGPMLFEVHRTPSVVEDELRLSLSFLDESGPVSLAPGAHPRARILVTSAGRASDLELGDIGRATETSPVNMTFRNITSVSRGSPPIFTGDRLWELLRFAKLGMPALVDRHNLGRVLALLNDPAWFKWPNAKANAETFEPLLAVQYRRGTFVSDGEIWPGIEVAIDFDAATFLCEGDIDLFGEILTAFLASSLEEHEWLTLTVRVSKERSFDYGRRFGTRGVTQGQEP